MLPAKSGELPIEAWEAAEAKQIEAHGLAPLHAETERAFDDYCEAWDALAAAPAQSVAGIAIKLAAALHWDDGLQEVWVGHDPGEKGERMILAARADALRLAGLPHTFGIDEPESAFVEEGA